MKKRYIGIAGLGLVLALGTQQVHAQQGFGTTEPDKSAAVDIQSSKRGLLIPRVNLAATTDKVTVKDPAQSLMVYNQATTTGENLVTPGYYYWDTNRWVRFAQQGDFSEITLAGDVTGKVGETKVVALQGTAISNVAPTANQVLVFVPGEGTNPGKWEPTDLPTQPWNVQGGNTKATENTQNIYQQGKVGIGFTKDSIATKTLDVRGDFKTEGKLGNLYTGVVTNEPIESFNSSILYSSKKPFTSYVDLASQAEHSFLMLSDAGTMIQRQGSSSKSLLSIGAQSDDYSLTFSGDKAGKSSTIQMNEELMYLKQANSKSDSQIRLKANEGITFSTLLEDNTRSSYIFPTSNGNANQVLTTNGVQATNSTSAQLTWKSVTDLITPGTEGQVLTTTKDGDNDPKVEWKAPAVHENIYTHDGTLVSTDATKTTRVMEFGQFTQLSFESGNQSHNFTYDSTHTGINMFGDEIASINLIATDSKFDDQESKLQMYHTSTQSEINANSDNGLWITAGLEQKIKLGKRYFLPGENNAKYDAHLEINDNGAVRVNNINNFPGAKTDKIVVADATGVLKTTTAAMPKVFYMPPVMFNTAAIGTGKTRNLYNEYVAMYGGTGTVVDMPNRSPLKKNDDAENTTIPVFGVKELDFYVSYYDPEVFANVNVDNNGVLTYDVKKKAKYGSFMTIVFVVRDNARQ